MFLSQLAGVFRQLGESESQTMANLFVVMTQHNLDKDKKAEDHYRKNKKTMSAKDLSSTLHRNTSLVKRKKQGRKGEITNLGSWSPGLAQRYWTSLDRPATISQSRSNLLFENKGATKISPLHLKHSNLYRTQGIMDRLNSHESGDLNEILKTTRPSFYTLGDFMEPVHHRVSSDDGSITEYEEVDDPINEENQAFGNVRHLKDLQKVN